MTFSINRPCVYAGGMVCPNIVTGGGSLCPEHKTVNAADYNRARGSSTKQGYDSKWGKVRARALDRDNYCCVICKRDDDRDIPAKDVDHIIPFKSNSDPLRLDIKNLQSLCRQHHNEKTRKGNR